MRRLYTLLVALPLLASLMVACAGGTPTPSANSRPQLDLAAGEALKVAFVYNTPIGDLGWTWTHDQGRSAINETFGERVRTTYVEDVSEEQATQVIRDFAQQGYHLIFTPAAGFLDPTLEVAKEFPNTWFVHASGNKTALNVSTVFGRMEIPRYLSGLVAGSMTESNIIGYVASFDIPEVVRGINAFTLGVRAINPDAEVRVLYTDTWFDPPHEREVTQTLIDQGADIIAQHQDSIAPQETARDSDALSIGYHSDMSQFVGETVLTSPGWKWEEKYTDIVREVIEDSYQSESYYGAEVVLLTPFSTLVAEEIRVLVEAQEAAIRGGTADVFCGPIRSNTGVLVIAEGNCLTDAELLSMDWYVEGVVGEAPAEAKEGLGEASSKVPAWKISE